MDADAREAALNTMDERDALRKRVVELEWEVERLTKMLAVFESASVEAVKDSKRLTKERAEARTVADALKAHAVRSDVANAWRLERDAALARAEKAEAEAERLMDALTMLRARYGEAERSMVYQADRAEKAEAHDRETCECLSRRTEERDAFATEATFAREDRKKAERERDEARDHGRRDLRRKLSECVNMECNCGGRGPDDHPCMACRVWHRFDAWLKGGE